jgi:hypothetical protein
MKQQGLQKPKYEDIHIPKNTASGIYISLFAFLAGFGFVWHIVWLAVVSLIGIIIVHHYSPGPLTSTPNIRSDGRRGEAGGGPQEANAKARPLAPSEGSR